MSIHSRAAVFVAAGFVLAGCAPKPREFDFRKVEAVEVGEVPPEWLKKPPPTQVGEIAWYRGEMNSQVIAVIHIKAPCPRTIHTFAGADPHKDFIELCFSGPPIDAPVPGFACSTDVYVKYEFLGLPKDVEPKFQFKGECFDKSPKPGLATPSSATPPSTP
jgi:hypothetical protein